MMKSRQWFLIAGLFFGIAFLLLLLVRLDLFPPAKNDGKAASTMKTMGSGESWMAVYQDDKKIGFSHETIAENPSGYAVSSKILMRLNTMGMVQTLSVTSTCTTARDFSLEAFTFRITSGRFDFTMKGKITDNTLRLTPMETNASPMTMALDNPVYLPSTMNHALAGRMPNPTEERTIMVFDPSTLEQAPVSVTMVAREPVTVMGRKIETRKLAFSFKGTTQYAWVNADGEVVREEGLLGITLVKSDRETAMQGITAGADLTQRAGIRSNVTIPAPERLSTLEVKISGVDVTHLDLAGGRQAFKNGILTITKEILDRKAPAETLSTESNRATGQSAASSGAAPGETGIDRAFVTPGPFVQSDHPRIIALARTIASPEDPRIRTIEKILAWMKNNIRKRPVLSLPSALAALENKTGDCNEHAVLFAALCRALKIPAGIETGLVYTRETFFYHAWNRVYLNGRWVTVDALFNQMPADVTHIRFTAGAGGMGLDLLGVIGRLKLEVTNRKF
ncbi:MAG TPA: transglutaminase domain-containing protein [Desulfobacteraceae bacterium]|nr:transglutaminase domain-containing protein [Desulfobacteraceae bacterium]